MSSSASALVRRHWLYTLLLLVPMGLALEAYGGDPLWVFGAAGLAIVPLAGWMGRVTEHLASRLGEGIGGLVLAVLAVNHIVSDGECNWMEGVQLLAVYLILGLAFYFLPAAP